jgi:hypothetical protein
MWIRFIWLRRGPVFHLILGNLLYLLTHSSFDLNWTFTGTLHENTHALSYNDYFD